MDGAPYVSNPIFLCQYQKNGDGGDLHFLPTLPIFIDIPTIRCQVAEQMHTWPFLPLVVLICTGH